MDGPEIVEHKKNIKVTHVINSSWQNQGRQEHGWFGHGRGDGISDDIVKVGDSGGLPTSGTATVYPDFLNNHPVQMGRGYLYRSRGYSAALLGRFKGAIEYGTHVLLQHDGRKLVVEVNDYGPGGKGKDNVLDLSHAAAAFLIGRDIDPITPLQIGVVRLDRITVVSNNTPVGPQ